MTDSGDAIAARAAELLAEPRSDRENLALYSARLERRCAAFEELIATLEFVRDNARDDSPAMWDRVDAVLARAGGAK